VSLYNTRNADTKPLDILSNPAKVAIMLSVFDPKRKLDIVDSPMSKALLNKADLLCSKLESLMRAHIMCKVLLCLQENKCLPWATKNLALVSAWMILAGHVKDDITCLDDSKCLLAMPTGNKFLPCSNNKLLHRGCYIHYDRKNGTWIQSGSATVEGGGIGKRLNENLHQAKAGINQDGSCFYASYPSKSSARATCNQKQGYFESLEAYVGVTFAREDVPRCFSSSDGLLEHKKEEAEWINKLNFTGKSGEQKYKQMADYLFELGYDLALAPLDNVSQSPGFEGCGLRRKD
jgi:hypothetical protein